MSSYRADCLLVNLFIVSANLLVAVIVHRFIKRNLLKERISPPQERVLVTFARAKVTTPAGKFPATFAL